MYQSDIEYQQRVVKWEASLPGPPKGNSMTQVYYTSRLLPMYAEEINRHRIQEGLDCIFQQDNDPSHGTRSEDNLPKRFLIQNWITSYLHPPQSPDLNPIEAIWNILKQRVRQRFFNWHSIEALKQIVLEEWDRISMAEIRARIVEMPERCKHVIQGNGFPVKSSLW
jgi:transposase